MKSLISPLLAFSIALTIQLPVYAKSAEGAIEKLDQNGDGKVSLSEWRKGKKKFNMLDANKDGYISYDEFAARFGGGKSRQNLLQDMNPKNLSAMRRSKKDDIQDAVDKGLFATGLHAVWPDDIECRQVDHTYAMDYRKFRGREAYHGGIDIPAPYDTPVLAAMEGKVIAVYEGIWTPRGIEVVLQHTPKQSGYPYYMYTRYTHFKKLPSLKKGQKIAIGETLGITGNTGANTKCKKPFGCENKRRSLLHFDVLYSESPKYFDSGRTVVPINGYYMDPTALYRKKLPLDSRSMKNLPTSEKAVAISYQTTDGEMFPAGTKAIWPYACSKIGNSSPNTKPEGINFF